MGTILTKNWLKNVHKHFVPSERQWMNTHGGDKMFESWVGACFAIQFVHPKTVPVGLLQRVPEDVLGVLYWGINLPIMLAVVSHERCFCCRNSRQPRAVYGFVLSCWMIPPIALISGITWCCSRSGHWALR